MNHYFKKVDPRIPILLSGGFSVQFTAVNRQTGIFSTDNGDVASQLDGAAKSNRGGVTRITEAEYFELVQKKIPDPFKRNWRDELSNMAMRLPNDFQDKSPSGAGGAATANQPDSQESSSAASDPKGPVNAVRPTASRR